MRESGHENIYDGDCGYKNLYRRSKRALQQFTSRHKNSMPLSPIKYSRCHAIDMSAAMVADATTIRDIHVGTGADIYKHIRRDLENVESELVLVTCFWARSQSLDTLNHVLYSLSAKGTAQHRKIVVRICFSSMSLVQKLFHTRSLDGHVYDPREWRSRLGLPDISALPGLDLHVKSIFVLPFSVMHPKFIILDRAAVILPSCNVSWEDWLEGMVKFDGPLVQRFLDFYRDFWEPLATRIPSTPPLLAGSEQSINVGKSVFLPSPHHVNPRFRPFPWQVAASPPATPLNDYLLHLFATVRHDLYIQTPNLTSPPVLDALYQALARGVNIHIVTSKRLMIMEQLVTSGTTTSRCIDRLVHRHNLLSSGGIDLEAGQRPGRLLIEYYESNGAIPQGASSEAVQSHVKVTIADGETVVLGSGNFDRASWYTSQELGVAFTSTGLAKRLRDLLARYLHGRTVQRVDL